MDYNSINDGSSSNKGSMFMRFLILVVVVLSVISVAVSFAVLQHVKHNKTEASSTDAINELKAMVQQLQLQTVKKYSVPMLLPREFQEMRGTCWDFSTVEFLEHQYRIQGIRKGFLRSDQYVKFSKQSYGISLMDLCRNNDICKFPGDNIAYNSTEGGEVPLLFYFASQLSNAILPESACPYPSQAGNDTYCPGRTDALKTNPLKFSMTANNYSTFYDVDSVKQALLTRQYLLAWSSNMFTTSYYQPCQGSLINDSQCAGADTRKCTLCPLNKNFPTACCVKTVVPMYNFDGEFYYHDGMDLEGGHAMALAGFNDGYKTRTGFTGGFILRNTWHDGVTPLGRRGSHSIRYFMQEISEMDERAICPNSMNPHNWYPCTSITDCTSVQSQQTSVLANQPLILQCVDSAQCDTSVGTTYYYTNLTVVGNDMIVMCFVVSKNGADAGNFCLPPTIPDFITTAIQPIPSQRYNNSDDECGYYIFPYQVLRDSAAAFGSFFVNDFSIEWADQSYTKNAASYAAYNYTTVTADTKSQMVKTFTGAYPNLPRSYSANRV